LVTENPHASRALQLAAEIAAHAEVETTVEVSSPAQLSSTAWDEIGLVLWQAPLPSGKDAALLEAFVENEGRLLLLPPKSPGSSSVFGFSWGNWRETPKEISVGNWRGDADLLAHTQNGSALPVGELKIHRTCSVAGDMTPLATLSGGDILLGRMPTARGGVYALATTALKTDSSLATDGVVLYVMVRRALAEGCQRLGQVRQQVAGSLEKDSSDWDRLLGADTALSNQYALHSGVFKRGEKLLALNRSKAEDATRVLSTEQTDQLLEGLDWVRLDSQADESSSLVNEIWRLFLIIMLIALLAEAMLCMPKIRPATRAVA